MVNFQSVSIGIKKTARPKTTSKKGQECKMIRNSRWASRGTIAKRAGGGAWDKYVEERDAAGEKRG